MRQFDDQIWVDAAERLGLAMWRPRERPWHAEELDELTRELEHEVDPDEARGAHWIAGVRRGRQVIARRSSGHSVKAAAALRPPLRYGLRRARTAAVVVEGRHVLTPPSIDPRDGSILRALVQSPSQGAAIDLALRSLGLGASLKIVDTYVEVDRAGLPEGAQWHVDAVEVALLLAERVGAAAAALPRAEWEAPLEARWSTLAGHELAFDPERLVLEGLVARLPVRAAITLDGPAIQTSVRVQLARPLGIGLRLTREKPLGKLRYLFLQQDIRTGDPAFDDAFVVQGRPADAVRAVLGGDARRLLLSILAKGAAITLEEDHLDATLAIPLVDPMPLLEDMTAAARAITELDRPASPYR